jgi:hypothetical protein
MSPVTRRSYSDGRDTLLPASSVVVEMIQVERPRDSSDDPDLATDVAWVEGAPVDDVEEATAASCEHSAVGSKRTTMLWSWSCSYPPPFLSNISKSYQNTASLLIAFESKLTRLMSFNQPN